jgi:hypothetical protein
MSESSARISIKTRRRWAKISDVNFSNFTAEPNFNPFAAPVRVGGGVIATPDMMSGGTNFDLFIGYFSGSS